MSDEVQDDQTPNIDAAERASRPVSFRPIGENPYTEEYKKELTERKTQELLGGAFGGKSRDQWIQERTAALVIDPNEADGDEFMAENQATAEYDNRAKELRSTADVTVAKMEALYRTTAQQGNAVRLEKASAVARANDAAARSGLVQSNEFPGIFFDPNTGQYYRQSETGLVHITLTSQEEEFFKQHGLFSYVARPEPETKSPPPKPQINLKQFTKNLQAQLFNKMGDFNKEEFKIPCDQKIYRMPKDENNQSGTFTQRLSTEALFSSGAGGFLQATPAQLGSLMPLLRFYLVDQDGNQEEIYFSDIVSEEHIKKMANLKGKSVDEIINYKTNRGGEAGIKSFRWNFDNKHEGDYVIGAQLELYFGSLVELANINYLKFLFPTGNDVDIAQDLSDKAADRRARTTGKSKPPNEVLSKLKTEIDAYEKVLGKGNKELKSFISKRNSQITSSSKKNFRQLKVIVGWSIPEGSESQLHSVYGADKFKQFKKDIKKTQTAILLNLYDYNVNFTQEGPTTLSLSYLGSTDNYLANDSSDIFGSNNFNTQGLNDFLFKDTKVSLEGILEENNLLSDAMGARSDSAAARITASAEGNASVNVRKLRDP